jgi:hypothetical protein
MRSSSLPAILKKRSKEVIYSSWRLNSAYEFGARALGKVPTVRHLDHEELWRDSFKHGRKFEASIRWIHLRVDLILFFVCFSVFPCRTSARYA